MAGRGRITTLALALGAVGALGAGAACAGSWSDPRPAPGTPAPAQPTRTDLGPDKTDSLRAAFLLDSIARADSVRADSLRRAGGAAPGRR